MTRLRRSALGLLTLIVTTLGTTGLVVAQETSSHSDTSASETVAIDVDSIDLSELVIRLAPLPLDQLTPVLTDTLAALQVHAEELADAIILQRRLRAETEPDAQAILSADNTLATLIARAIDLSSRTSVVISAVERKGGDVATAQAYVSAVGELVSDNADADEALVAGTTKDSETMVHKRVASLVALVRAEPPAHERSIPWEVPLSEFELELQPLPMESILERLAKWREILQREVRKRVRIDILLNDSRKLEQISSRNKAVIEAAGASPEEIDIAAIKSRLAQRSQEQQKIINDIVRRMEVAILLVKRRGGDAQPYTKYIAAATGQKLNLTDLSVLRAQTLAWLRSPDGGVSIGLAIARFLGIVGLFWLLSRLLGRIALAAVTRVPRSSSLLAPVLVGTVRRVTLFIGLVIGVSMFGVDVGPLLAMIGAAGLVIGLALQGTLSNFASGILILMNRPYDVGNVINAGGVLGKVEAMNLVSTTILTFDNQLMLVPNNQIWNGVITNVTGKATRRIDMTFGIGYGDDMDKAVRIISEVIAEHPKVHAEPAPNVRVHELADNSVNIIARPWAATADYMEVHWDVMHAVKIRFDQEDINIPYPQRDVHLAGPLEIKLSRTAAEPA